MKFGIRYKPTSSAQVAAVAMNFSSGLLLLVVASLCQWVPIGAEVFADVPLIGLNGELVIVLLNVASVMDPNLISEYESDIKTFLDTHFLAETPWSGEIPEWSVKLDSQEQLTCDKNGSSSRQRSRRQRRRQLRQEEGQQQQIVESLEDKRETQRRVRSLQPDLLPLVTRFTVTARATESLGLDTFESLIKQVIDSMEAEFLLSLQESDSVVAHVYFKPVLTTETFGPSDEVTTQVNCPEVSDIASEDDDGDEDDGDSSGLSSRTIAGIAAAAGFVTVLIVGILCVTCGPDSDDEKDEEFAGSQNRGVGGSVSDYQSRGYSANDNASSASGLSSRYRSRNLGALRTSTTKVVSSDGRILSVLPGTSSDFGRKEEPREAAPSRRSNMSDGDPTPVFEDEVQGNGGEEEVQDGNEYQDDEEQQERSQVGSYESAYQQDPTSSYQGASTQSDVFVGDSQQREQEERSTEQPSQSQQSSLQQPSELSSQAAYPNFSRQVVAPPGKLGIVIETTIEGPVVHKINDGSPLEGKVFEGELITAIDDIDTRAMSASAITSLMVRTAGNPRTMTVRSGNAG